jgi:hypothetical protein
MKKKKTKLLVMQGLPLDDKSFGLIQLGQGECI